MSQAPHPARALRAIALFEAFKGAVALAALLGVIDLMHQDAVALAMSLIGRFGLNPEAHYPSMLLHYANLLPDADMRSLVLLASAYMALRWAEALGLWLGQSWGEYLGALSGGIYVPFELKHFWHAPSLATAVVIALNLAIVAYLCHHLWQRHTTAS